MVILLVTIIDYSIGSYWCLYILLMVISLVTILFMVILLVTINGYFINGYWWLFINDY